MNKRITDIEYFQKLCSEEDEKAYVGRMLRNYGNAFLNSEVVEYLRLKNTERILSCVMGRHDSVHLEKIESGYIAYYDKSKI